MRTLHLAPTPPRLRYPIIDIIRGFALFGVLLANMLWTTQWFAVPEEEIMSLSTASIDRVTSAVILALVDYKFYTLFSLLFGLGFAIQLDHAKQRGQDILPIYSRRLIILWVMGIGHALLLWFGDILHVYALLGFVLLLMHKISNKLILKCAIGIAILISAFPFLNWVYTPEGSHIAGGLSETQLIVDRYNGLSSTNWLEVIEVNWNFNRTEYANLSLKFDETIYWYLSVLWKFMIGFILGRNKVLQDSEKYLVLYRKLLPWGLTLGLLGCTVFSGLFWVYGIWIPNENSMLSLTWMGVEICMIALSLSYAAALILLYQQPKWKRMLSYLAPVGRTALTNYLSQSVFLVLIFYGVGFGLLSKVGSTFCLILGLILFGLQVAISNWWLTRFRFGPIEWIWRSFTYGKIQPWRSGGLPE